MLSITTCLRGSRPFFQKVSKASFPVSVRVGRDAPNNLGFSRSLRLSPIPPASMRSRFGRNHARNKDFDASAPLTLDAGRIAIAAGAALGLGGLCLYGFMSSPSGTDAMSALDRAALWPDYVRERIQKTYAYLAGGAVLAAGAAASLARSPTFCRLMTSSGWIAPIGMMIASMGAGVVCQMIPYPSSGGIGVKHLAWAVFASSIGAMLMPVCLIGGPILTRAALYTGGIVGGMSAVALSAPSDKFLFLGGPLAIGLGIVVVSSLGSMFLSPVSRLGSGMAVISLYGGLLLFSGFLLYDTQMVVRRAESHPVENPYTAGRIRPFDPINNSIHILMDAVNIFVRLVAIFSGGGQRRK